MRTTLEELDHPQSATQLRTDNSTADSIVNKTIKQKQNTAMNKRFYQLQDRVEQGEFRVFWVQGKYNLVEHFTKYHSPVTHRKLRPINSYIKDKRPTSLQGCIEILTKESANSYSNRKATKSGNQTNPISNSNTASQQTIYSLLDKLTKALTDRLMSRLV